MQMENVVIYVDYNELSKKVEWYAVRWPATGQSELWREGHCDGSLLPSEMYELSKEWLWQTTEGS